MFWRKFARLKRPKSVVNWQHKHEHGHEDGWSGVTNVGEVPTVGDPFEEVPPSEDKDGFSEEPEEDEDPKASQY